MKIEGSCYCGQVKFKGTSPCTVPIQRCYCEQCRKCNGSPVSTYLQCDKNTLTITEGRDKVTVFETPNGNRQFCSQCGSTLFFAHSKWPDCIYPAASAIDTPLKVSDRYVHIFVKDKIPWFSIDTPGPQFDEYSDKTSLEWHKEFSLDHE